MIVLVSRSDLDVKRYNDCVATAIQSNVFGFSWYLDEVAETWSVLVLNDYEAVMPIPWRKKLYVTYVYQPFWTIQLGIFSKEAKAEDEFLVALFSAYKYVSLRMNTNNSFHLYQEFLNEKRIQQLSLDTSYDSIAANYRKDRKKDLRKAKKYDLTENWNENPEVLITLFKENVGKRIHQIKEKDYNDLLQLMQQCIKNKVGELLVVYDKSNTLVAAGFFIKYKGKVQILVSSTDFKNRNNGANTFLIDSAIYKYQPFYDTFDFGGSSMKTIAEYFMSFGAKNTTYTQLHYNNLPRFLRLFKR